MRWTYENVTTMLLGLSIGMWGASWLAMISPWLPLFLSFPLAGWVLWRTGEIVQRHRQGREKSVLGIIARRTVLMKEWEGLGDDLFKLTHKDKDE